MPVRALTFEPLVPEDWTEVPAEVGREWQHPSGLGLRWRVHEGPRTRVELTVLPADDVAQASAPRLRVHTEHPLVPWLAGAGAHLVAMTPDGPVHAVLRRGTALGEPSSMSVAPEPLVVAPGHALGSVWVVEQLAGDLLDLPPEPDWLPPRVHVPMGEEIRLALPDQVVTGVECTEDDEEVVLADGPGLHVAEIAGPAGVNRLEVGWHLDRDELLAAAMEGAPDDLWCALAARRDDVDPDEYDARLTRALAHPTTWALLAAAARPGGGCSPERLREAAEALATHADVPTRVALFSRGLVGTEHLVGVQLGKEAYAALARFGFGRPMTGYPEGAERELASVWLWLAGLGESPLAARVGAMAGRIQARALCRVSGDVDREAVAWLTLFD